MAFVEQRMFSAAFYSAGKALPINDLQQIPQRHPEGPLFIAVPRTSLQQSSPSVTRDCHVVGDAPRYRLLLWPSGDLVGRAECLPTLTDESAHQAAADKKLGRSLTASSAYISTSGP